MYPVPPGELSTVPAAAKHEAGWNALQAGDFRAAERSFQAALKEASAFYPAEAGLGYLELAKKSYADAVSHFDRAIAVDPVFVPALVGRGEAQLALGQNDGALRSFEAAVAASPDLTDLRSRIEVLRFRALQDEVAAARKAAEAGRMSDARTAYQRAIAASPQSPFLYRELAAVERRDGNLPDAIKYAEKAAELDPTDTRALILLAEIYEIQGNYLKAADTFAAATALEPNEAIEVRIEELREKAAFASMPDEYKTIDSAQTVTRAQLAALIGVRLDDLLRRSRRRNAVVITDTRSNWAAPWILSVSRAGIMEPYPNHTFQPGALVRRGDLALASSRVLSLIAAENPRMAASWRNPRRRFPDLSPGHLSHPAAALAVEAGVMTTAEDGSFQLTRAVTGAEAVAAVRTLEDLAEKRGR
jgi:tetratricopeptide (TPR) repeat protein